MDAWSDREMEVMRVGGNKAMRQFFADQGFPKALTIEQKYHSEAAGLYRERIKQLAEGADPTTLRPIPTIGYKEEAVQAAYSANGSGGVMQPAKARADSLGSASGGYSSGGGNNRSDRSGSFQDDGDSSRPKMQGFGSNGQSHNNQHAGSDSGSADFFGSLSSSFFSAAKYTQQAVAHTAAVVGPKLSQAGATIKAKTAETTEQLKQKDLVGAAAQKTAAGWSAVTSFVGGYVAAGGGGDQPPKQGKYASFGSDSLDADGNPLPILPASSSSSGGSAAAAGGLFGLPRPEVLGTGKKYEGLGSEGFKGFGDDDEEEERERKKQQQQQSRPAQRGAASKSPPSGGSSKPTKSILAQAMVDNEATTADDPEDEDAWGWNDTPATKTTAAPITRKTSPPAPAATSLGRKTSSSGADEEDASPTKAMGGMKLTSKSTTPPPAATAAASSTTASSKAKKSTSILAQIHDDDEPTTTTGKKDADEFGGFDDDW